MKIHPKSGPQLPVAVQEKKKKNKHERRKLLCLLVLTLPGKFVTIATVSIKSNFFRIPMPGTLQESVTRLGPPRHSASKTEQLILNLSGVSKPLDYPDHIRASLMTHLLPPSLSHSISSVSFENPDK